MCDLDSRPHTTQNTDIDDHKQRIHRRRIKIQKKRNEEYNLDINSNNTTLEGIKTSLPNELRKQHQNMFLKSALRQNNNHNAQKRISDYEIQRPSVSDREHQQIHRQNSDYRNEEESTSEYDEEEEEEMEEQVRNQKNLGPSLSLSAYLKNIREDQQQGKPASQDEGNRENLVNVQVQFPKRRTSDVDDQINLGNLPCAIVPSISKLNVYIWLDFELCIYWYLYEKSHHTKQI